MAENKDNHILFQNESCLKDSMGGGPKGLGDPDDRFVGIIG